MNLMNLNKYAKEFQEAGPFPNIVIDNVFPDSYVSLLAKEVADLSEDGKWFIYNSPLEKKHAREDLPPNLQELANSFQNVFMVQALSNLVGCELIPNPDLYGAGLHRISSGGKLDIHLDHNRLDGMERKLNVIYWFHDVRKILPKRNRMAIFECSETSFHGHPDPLKCPADIFRTSLALYYYTKQVSDAPERPKVNFYPRPNDTDTPALRKLRLDRSMGRKYS